MSYHRIKAGINLYAVLKNLEDLVILDEQSQRLIKDKNISIQFIVRKGPKAWVKFNNNRCEVGTGIQKGATIKLWFKSPQHLNLMFDGKANPIPLWGFTQIGFLTNEFTQITKRLAYYLQPENLTNPNEDYIKINTRFTLTLAAFALSEIGKYDKEAQITAHQIPNGNIQMTVAPNTPAVYLRINNGSISAFKGTTENPDALMEMKDITCANNFLHGKSNPFLAIASGDIAIKGQTPMLDKLSLILDKVQHYIS